MGFNTKSCSVLLPYYSLLWSLGQVNSAVIGSNLSYAAIHQLGGQAGRNKKVKIPARPYINLTDDDFKEIMHETENYL